MLNFLSGKRTYFIAAGIAVATAAKYLGYITDTQYEAIVGFLGAGSLATMRMALK